MHTFRVWAPVPHRIEVEVCGGRHAMKRLPNDWWIATVPEAKPGCNYGFILDGEGPIPDPRSLWQPEGVHGPSRILDHSAFVWTDQGFQAPPLAYGLIYELHVGTFTPEGTFDAAISRLEHLATLGVTHVELMPVNAFSGHHGWGYDGVDLFAVHEPYGGPEGLKRFVNACHRRGIAVLLDVVYNHLGPAGNYLGRFAPYFNSRYQTPWGWAVNFDGPYSDEVRRFCCDNAAMWLKEYHIDGLRLDAVHAILDTSAQPFLEQLGIELGTLQASTGRHFVIIPESDLNDPRLLWPPERGGFGLHAQWSDDFHHALHSVLTGEKKGYYEDFGTIGHLAKAIRNAYVYDGDYSVHRHRRHGRPHGGLSGHRFIAYLQNHDQVGNRARGERISHLVSPARVKIGAALLLTSPFVPMLFMGEEWGASTPFQYFTDHPDPELARAVSEGRRREFAAFGWNPDDVPDPQSPETFQRSKLNWSECSSSPHAEILEWHRRLIQLRRRESALSDGRLDLVHTRHDEAERWLLVERGPITIACNFSDTQRLLPIRKGRHDVLIASTAPPHPLPNPDKGLLPLPPESIAILKATDDAVPGASEPPH